MRLKREPVGDDDTMAKVLSAAEILFAEKGHEKASLRELTARAGVNLAAVNYHFGSKEGLAEAVFESLSRRVNEKRVADLEHYLAGVPSAELPSLDRILEIFVAPYLAEGNDAQGILLARFILHHRLAPSDLTQRIMRKHFDPMAKCFVEALSRACPHVDTAELFWRYMFMVSSVVLTLTDTTKDNRIARLSGGRADTSRRDEFRGALIRFLKGGIAAPARQDD
jgi:AcrR family transcriptional regulator